MLNDPENLLTYMRKRQDTEEQKDQPAWTDQLLQADQNLENSKLNKSHAFTEKNNAMKDFDNDQPDDIIYLAERELAQVDKLTNAAALKKNTHHKRASLVSREAP